MWFILSCLLLCVVAVVSGRWFDSPRGALWGTWTVAVWFLQIYIAKPFGSMVIDLRLIAVGLGVLGILVHLGKPREPGSARLWPALSDFALMALFAVIVVSQYTVGRLSPLGPAELARKWVFPYLAGRLFIGSNRDLKRVAPLMSGAIMIVCAMAIVEALTKVNIPNTILGRRYGVLEAGEGYRWGMKRAQGSMDHPIFFGMALVMSMPWALHGMEIAKSTKTRKWMKFAPWALAVGLFATVSRGPQFCSLVPVGTYFFFRKPRLRVPIVLGALLGGLFLYSVRDQILGVLGKMAGEKEEMVSTIEIGGEPYEYTGTRHRILLWIAYREAIEKLPAFGYGLELRGVPLDDHLAMRFGSIDGHYLMFLLQHGYYAIGLFLTIGVLGMINSAYVALNRKKPAATLAAGLFGAILAVLGNLSSVWFPPDFGGVWLFCVGLAATLARLPASVASEDVQEQKSKPEESGRGRSSPAVSDRPLRSGGTSVPIRPSVTTIARTPVRKPSQSSNSNDSAVSQTDKEPSDERTDRPPGFRIERQTPGDFPRQG